MNKESVIYKNNKPVGKIVGDVYYTSRVFAIHYFIKHKGYGISKDIVDILYRYNVKTIIINVDDTEKLNFSVKDYLNSSKTYRDGDDLQLFVSVEDSRKNKRLDEFENDTLL